MGSSGSDEELYYEFLEFLHRRRRERAQAGLNPFVLLERLVHAGLLALERAVRQLVRAIIR